MGELNQQVAYKPVHKNPMDKNRSPTDVIYLYIFGVLLAAWFITNCTYLFKGNTMGTIMHDEIFINITQIAQNQAIVSLPTFFHQNGSGLIIWIAIAGTIIFLLFLKTLNCLAKFWSVVALVIMPLIIVGFIVTVIMAISVAVNMGYVPPKLVFNIFKTFIYCLIIIAAINATCTVKLDGLAEVIRKTSHAIFFFPTVFLFGLIIMLLSLTVIAFTAVSLYSIDNELVGILSLIGGIYLISVIGNFAVIVISQCISTWYWSENKEELSGFLILKSIGLVGRNHFGSIVFCSTAILPIILSLYVLCKNKYPPPPNSGFKAFLVKLFLIFYASDYALVLIASHGIRVHEAMKKVYSLFTRSCAMVLSFCVVFGTILAIFLAIAMLISLGVAVAIFQQNSFDDKDLIRMGNVLYGIGIYLFVAVFATAAIAGNTVLVNTTEEVEENEEREMVHVHGNV